MKGDIERATKWLPFSLVSVIYFNPSEPDLRVDPFQRQADFRQKKKKKKKNPAKYEL